MSKQTFVDTGRDQRYVLGFVFAKNCPDMVLLQRKARPPWQFQLFNGIGGKAEDGEKPVYAMIREMAEEVQIPLSSTLAVPSGWKLFARYMPCPQNKVQPVVFCFVAEAEQAEIGPAKTDEICFWYCWPELSFNKYVHVSKYAEFDLVNDVPMLVTMAQMALRIDNFQLSVSAVR